MDDMSLLFAKRLKKLRESMGLSLVALSKALEEKYGIKISKESLTNYEVTDSFHSKARKNEGMSVKYLRCLADFYGVSTDYLLDLSDIPTSKPDIQSACLTTGLEETAVDFLEFLKNTKTIDCNYALEAINFLLSGCNVDFWKKLRVYFANSGKAFSALIEGETKTQEFSADEVLSMYLAKNNEYLKTMRLEWQQTHKKEETENGQH